jgi:hypothetical protein
MVFIDSCIVLDNDQTTKHILAHRINTLMDFVCKFIIVFSNVDIDTGEEIDVSNNIDWIKDIIPKEHLDRIVCHVTNENKGTNRTERILNLHNTCWEVAKEQKIQSEDIIMFSEVDEIPNPLVTFFSFSRRPVCLDHMVFNTTDSSLGSLTPYKGTVIVKASTLTFPPGTLILNRDKMDTIPTGDKLGWKLCKDSFEKIDTPMVPYLATYYASLK